MRVTSVFCFQCLCGRYIETEARMLECPSCHRQLVIEWGRKEEKDSGGSEFIETLNVRSAA